MYLPYEEDTFVGKETMPPLLPIYTEECHTWSGVGFPCDTDYRVKERLTVNQILGRMPDGVKNVCISGGEPFIHNLVPLVTEAQNRKLKVHIETSGTVYLNRAFPTDISIPKNFSEAFIPSKSHTCQEDVWITLSPKMGVLTEMIDRANEIKILVDKDFNPNQLPISILQHENVFLQPINNERSIRADNLKLVMKWQQEYPNWRISLQMHKAVEMVIQERVL
jgi:organic radical activating enzyme